MLYVTHSADEMTRLADKLVVMADGKVRREGPLAEALADVKMPIETENGASVVLSGKVSSLSSEWKTCCIDAGAGHLKRRWHLWQWAVRCVCVYWLAT